MPTSLAPSARRLLANNAGWNDGLPTRWEPPRHLSPTERAEAHNAVTALSQMLRPASDDDFERSMMRLRMHCANAPKGDAKVLGVIMSDYRRLLGDIPADLLAGAVDAFIVLPEPPFWPSVGEFRALAEPALRERRNMLARAEKLAAGCDEKPRRGVASPDERKRMADGFSSLRDVLRNMPGPETLR